MPYELVLLNLCVEVERAVGIILSFGSGKRIEKVNTVEDKIVFSGTTHEEFVGFFLLRCSRALSNGRQEKLLDERSKTQADTVS